MLSYCTLSGCCLTAPRCCPPYCPLKPHAPSKIRLLSIVIEFFRTLSQGNSGEEMIGRKDPHLVARGAMPKRCAPAKREEAVKIYSL